MTISAAKNAAHLQRGLILLRCRGGGFRLLWRRQIGQCLCLIPQSDVGVLHRHLDVGMPGKLLGLRQRRPIAK